MHGCWQWGIRNMEKLRGLGVNKAAYAAFFSIPAVALEAIT